MNFKDGRGVKAREAKAETRAENVASVKGWLKDNPEGTPAECASDLNLSRNTVYSIKNKELSSDSK